MHGLYYIVNDITSSNNVGQQDFLIEYENHVKFIELFLRLMFKILWFTFAAVKMRIHWTSFLSNLSFIPFLLFSPDQR